MTEAISQPQIAQVSRSPPKKKTWERPKNSVEIALPKRIRGNYLDCTQNIPLISNLYRVKFPANHWIHIYSLKTTPNIVADSRRELNDLMNNVKAKLESEIGPFATAGRTLLAKSASPLCPASSEASLSGDSSSSKSKAKLPPMCFEGCVESRSYSLEIKWVRSVSLGEVFKEDSKEKFLALSFFNNMLRDFMRNKGYLVMGKNGSYFDPGSRKVIENARLNMFNGFNTSFNILENGFFLRVDPSVKVVRDESVLDVIRNVYRVHASKSKDEKRALLNEMVRHKSVVANYGKSQCYVVQAIIFDQTVDSYTFSNNNVDVTLRQYYSSAYNITIHDARQPLLEGVSGQGRKARTAILVPELMLMVGLPEECDERLRRELSLHCIVKPAKKLERLESLMHELQNVDSPYSVRGVSQSLGIEMEPHLFALTGKMLNVPDLQLGNSSRIDSNKAASFQLFAQRLFDTQGGFNVYLVHPEGYEINKVKELTSSTCVKLGLQCRLQSEAIDFRNAKGWQAQLKEITKRAKARGVAGVWIIMHSNSKGLYPSIKKILLGEDIVSQVSISNVLEKKSFATVCTKNILQLACKLGNKLWLPRISALVEKAGFLIIGIDSCKSTEGKSIVAYCANSDSHFSQFNSAYLIQTKGDLIPFRRIVTESISAYVKHQQRLPSEIVLLTKGVSQKEGNWKCASEIDEALAALDAQSLREVLQRNEHQAEAREKGDESVRTSTDTSQDPDLLQDLRPPNEVHLTFVAADLSSPQKFFTKGREPENPPFGMLVNSGAVSKDYDFYLIAQQCRMGCAKPVYFKVMWSNSSLEEGILQELIFSQCFNYMNWTGSIRVPSALQYAKKLAEFAAHHLAQPLETSLLANRLYFI